MEIPIALLADYANVSQEGKLNVMGIFGRILAQTIPWVHPQMQIVFTMVATPAEAGSERTLKLVLLDADGNQVIGIGAQFVVPEPPIPGKAVEINQVLTLNGVAFPHEGDYAFEILINDDSKRTIPLQVVRMTPEEAPPDVETEDQPGG